VGERDKEREMKREREEERERERERVEKRLESGRMRDDELEKSVFEGFVGGGGERRLEAESREEERER